MNQEVVINNSFTVECTAEGFPTPSIQWYHNYIMITNSSNRYIVETASMNSITSILRVIMADSTDSGVYHCEANSSVFVDNVKSDMMNISVVGECGLVYVYCVACTSVYAMRYLGTLWYLDIFFENWFCNNCVYLSTIYSLKYTVQYTSAAKQCTFYMCHSHISNVYPLYLQHLGCASKGVFVSECWYAAFYYLLLILHVFRMYLFLISVASWSCFMCLMLLTCGWTVDMWLLCSKNWALCFLVVLLKSPIILLRKWQNYAPNFSQ